MTLRRHGLSRLARSPRAAVRRSEWPCPGDLLHMDTKRFARFERPGHAVTGKRDTTYAEKHARWGHEFAHTIVDDHTRLASSELHPDERAATVTGFVTRALEHVTALGITTRRLMTDNAWTYTRNLTLARLLSDHEIHHLTIAPHRRKPTARSNASTRP